MLMWLLAVNLIAQEAQVRICTEQDIPRNMRENYYNYAGRMLEGFYSALPFCMENMMIQDDLVNTYFVDKSSRYTPDFKLTNKNNLSGLTPSQYIQEFQKQYSSYKDSELSLEISNITFEDDFYAPNMVSCYVIANYSLTLKADERTILSQRSQAYCIFPSSSNWITVKLMQISPLEAAKDNMKTVVREKGGTVTTDTHDKKEDDPYRRAYNKAKQRELEMANQTGSIVETFTCEGCVFDNAPQEEALTGASAVIEGTNNGTITDLDGNFKLDGVKEGDKIIVSFVGYRDYIFIYKRDYHGKTLRIPMVPTDSSLQSNRKNSATRNTKSDLIREEKVELVVGPYLNMYGVCCASFGVLANAKYLADKLKKDGYSPSVVFNKERGMYRVIVNSFYSAEEANSYRDNFISAFPKNADFKRSWILKAIK